MLNNVVSSEQRSESYYEEKRENDSRNVKLLLCIYIFFLFLLLSLSFIFQARFSSLFASQYAQVTNSVQVDVCDVALIYIFLFKT